MTCIEWEDRFSLGNAELDQHHRHLIDLLNRAYAACMLNNPRDSFTAVIAELVEYTHYHFTAEEHSMEQCGYPGLVTQQKEHALFIEKLADFTRSLESNPNGSSIELVELTGFLADWVVLHIINVDALFGDYLKNLNKTTDTTD